MTAVIASSHGASEYSAPRAKGLKARQGEFSHTETLCELVIEDLRPYNVECEIVRLVEHKIKPDVESDMADGDGWPAILKKILAADIIVFATPVWWGIQPARPPRRGSQAPFCRRHQSTVPSP